MGLFEIQSDSWEVVKDALSDELSSTGAAAAAAPFKIQPLFELISGGYSSHGSHSKQTVGFVCFAFFSHSPHRLISSHGQQIELSVSQRRGIQRLRVFGLGLCLFEQQTKAVGRKKTKKQKGNNSSSSSTAV